MKVEWTKHPAFKEHFDLLHNEAELDELLIAEQNVLIKELMRDAGKYVRDKLFDEDPNSLNNTLIRLGSISRCVWAGDCKLAKTLLGVSDLARKHLKINVVGFPELISIPLLKRH